VIRPVRGSAVYFHHTVDHEADPVTRGCKVVLRCDVLFRRVGFESPLSQRQVRSDPRFYLVRHLYRACVVAAQAGDAALSTRLFDEAQRTLEFSVEPPRDLVAERLALGTTLASVLASTDVFVLVLRFAHGTCLAWPLAPVSRSLAHSARRSDLWQRLYETAFAQQAQIERQLVPAEERSAALVHYGQLFRLRHLQRTGEVPRGQTLLLHIGSRCIRFALTGQSATGTNKSSIQLAKSVQDVKAALRRMSTMDPLMVHHLANEAASLEADMDLGWGYQDAEPEWLLPTVGELERLDYSSIDETWPVWDVGSDDDDDDRDALAVQSVVMDAQEEARLRVLWRHMMQELGSPAGLHRAVVTVSAQASQHRTQLLVRFVRQSLQQNVLCPAVVTVHPATLVLMAEGCLSGWVVHSGFTRTVMTGINRLGIVHQWLEPVTDQFRHQVEGETLFTQLYQQGQAVHRKERLVPLDPDDYLDRRDEADDQRVAALVAKTVAAHRGDDVGQTLVVDGGGQLGALVACIQRALADTGMRVVSACRNGDDGVDATIRGAALYAATCWS